MKELLKEISEMAIKLSDQNISFTELQRQTKWLGNNPATPEEIDLIEKRLGVTLPQDYKDFLKICNGFHSSTDIDSTFEKSQDVDYLKNVDSFLVNVWNQSDLIEIGKELARSIVIAGRNEEQYVLIIPPEREGDIWKYWKFASWLAGEISHVNLEEYFKDLLKYIKNQIEE